MTNLHPQARVDSLPKPNYNLIVCYSLKVGVCVSVCTLSSQLIPDILSPVHPFNLEYNSHFWEFQKHYFKRGYLSFLVKVEGFFLSTKKFTKNVSMSINKLF